MPVRSRREFLKQAAGGDAKVGELRAEMARLRRELADPDLAPRA